MYIYLSLILLYIFLSPLEKFSRTAYLLITLAILGGVIAFRSINVGNDTVTYAAMYPVLANESVDRLSLFGGDTRFELGYVFLNKLLYGISTNPQVLLIVVAFVNVLALGIFLADLSPNLTMSLTIYTTMGFLNFPMNAMRQSVSLSIMLIAFLFLIRGHNFRFIILILLATLFHRTAIIMLVAVLFVKMSEKYIVGIMAIGVTGILVFFQQLVVVISDNISTYSAYADSFESSNSGSLGILINIAIILGVLLFGKRYEKMIGDEGLSYVSQSTFRQFMNLMVVSLCIYIVAFRFSQISRVGMYMSIFMIVLIPESLRYIKDKNVRWAITGTIYVGSIVYFIVIQSIRPEWSGLVPYNFG